MSLTAEGYLRLLFSYLDTRETRKSKPYYGMLCKPKERSDLPPDTLVLADTDDATKERLKVKLRYSGKAFAIRLDATPDPLFHFLNNGEENGEKMPWLKKCDFVVFHAYQDKFYANCIEFKKARTFIPATDVMLQLNAAEAWCYTLHSILSSYANKSVKINLSKYLFTDCENPTPDLDRSGKYLKSSPDIRHYLFREVDGMALEGLENECSTLIG